jgi:hypothetical protein
MAVAECGIRESNDLLRFGEKSQFVSVAFRSKANTPRICPREADVLGHLSFGVNDLDRAATFYDRILAPLGFVRLVAFASAAPSSLNGILSVNQAPAIRQAVVFPRTLSA